MSPSHPGRALPWAIRSLGPREPLTPALARRLLLAILFLGLVVRVALIVLKGRGYHFADTAEYDAAARSLLAGHAPDVLLPRAPLYPMFMALVYRFAGPGNFPAVRLVQLGFGLGVIALTATLGRRMGAPRAGLLAALGVAVAPTLVYTTTMVYPNVLYTALVLGCTVLAHRIDRTRRALPALALGVLAGLAWLTDPVALAPVAALLVWLVVGAPVAWRKRLASVALATLAMAVVVGGWMMASGRAAETSPVFFAKAQYVLYEARHDSAVVQGHHVRDAAEAKFKPLPARQFVARELRLMREQPLAYLHDVGGEFLHFFDPLPDRLQTANVYTGRFARVLVTVYFLPVLVLAVIGAVAGIAARRDRWLLVAVPIATAALYAFFFTQMRYRVPTEPHLLLLAALGVRRLVRRFPRPAHEEHPRETLAA